MKKLDDMTIKASWLSVLLAFTMLVLIVGGLGGYSVYYSQSALSTVKNVQVEQKGTLNKANTMMLGLRLSIQNAYQKISTSDGNADVNLNKLEDQMATVRSVYENFLNLDIPPRYQSDAAKLETGYKRLFNQGLEPQLAALQAGDMTAYLQASRKADRLNGQFYVNAEEPYFLETESQGTALYNDFQGMALLLKIAILLSVLISMALILVVLWGINTNVLKPIERIAESVNVVVA